MKSESLGRVLNPSQILPEGYSHASTPMALELSGEIYKVFFSSRDSTNQSHIFSADFHFQNNQFTIIDYSNTPLLSPGQRGLFDQNGVSMGSALRVGDEIWIYYLGWSLQTSVPWMNTIGLAKSYDNGQSFKKVNRVPLLDRSEGDPFSMSYPWVVNIGKHYRLFYGSNLIWGDNKDEMNHVIKTAQSKDGIHWERQEAPLFRLTSEITAMSRPSVIRIGDEYFMTFSAKNSRGLYYLMTASSQDGKNWSLQEKLSFPTSKWDNISQAYPSLFFHNTELYCLYNGNEYGKSGFGILKLSS